MTVGDAGMAAAVGRVERDGAFEHLAGSSVALLGGFVNERHATKVTIPGPQIARRDAFPDAFMEDEANRLSKILDAAGIDECVLVGHSDGGTITLLHGSDRAPRIRGLVTITAHVTVDPTAAVYLDELDALLAAGAPPPWMKRFHGDRGPHLLACWIGTWRRSFADGWNIVPRLAAIEAPLLALQGADDPYKIPAHLDLIAGAVPGAETNLLENLGHFPHLEHPETVIREIAKFIDRADVRPSRT